MTRTQKAQDMSRFSALVSPSAAAAAAPAQAAGGAVVAPLFARRAPNNDLVEVVGYIDNVRIFGDWAYGSIWSEDRKAVKITGQMVKELQPGQQYRVSGQTRYNEKYGESLEVMSFAPHVSNDPKAIAKFMTQNFDGIGPKSAERMVRHALAVGGKEELEKLRQQLLTAPWTVDWSPTKREGVYNATSDETTAAFVQRDLTTRLSAFPGMTVPVLKLLARWALTQANDAAKAAGAEAAADPVQDSWAALSRNPYAAIVHVPGYGFNLADSIGKVVNIPFNAPQRLAALVCHALSRGCDLEGHVYLTERQFKASVQQADRNVDAMLAIQYGLDEDTIVRDDSFGEIRYYTPKLHEAEVKVAKLISSMLGDDEPLLTEVKGLEDKIQAAFRQGKEGGAKMSLDPSQVAAVKGMLTTGSRLKVMTGGPGCGKTALVETLVKMLPGKTFHFGAPTGKAAKVLSSRVRPTGHEASTIHSLLKGGEGGWQVNEDDPLEGDVLVVDEGSMPPLELYKAIYEGVNSKMHVIVVGDPNQLLSIQPGCVLADLIAMPGIPHFHLTTTHRNGGGILEVIKEIANGECLCSDEHKDVSFSHQLGDASEYFPVVLRDYLDAIGRRGIENVILLMSRRQGSATEAGWNTTYANTLLRDTLNPNAEKLPGSAQLHVYDRIIIRENMNITQKSDIDEDGYEDERSVRVVNGDTGQIVGYERHPAGKKDNGVKWLRIKLDDGRMIDFPGEAMKVLDHSYALTVHAAQGSEYAEVIGVFTDGMPGFINRNSLFTAASRPKGHMHFHAEDHVLRKIAATPAPKRNSALLQRVRENMGDKDVETDQEVAVAKSRFRLAA
jgi:exodeoxyribonuclease V alpha subunit